MSLFGTSDILLKAASRVEEEGMWCQNTYFADVTDSEGMSPWDLLGIATSKLNDRHAECVVGAIASATAQLGGDDIDLNDAVHLLNDWIGEGVAGWNDAPGRTAHEVADAMRKAAF